MLSFSILYLLSLLCKHALARSLAQSSICLMTKSNRIEAHYSTHYWPFRTLAKMNSANRGQANKQPNKLNYWNRKLFPVSSCVCAVLCCVCCVKTLNWCVYSLIFMCVLSKLKWFHLIHSHKIVISMPIKSFFSLHCCLLLLLLLIDFQSNVWCEYSIYYFRPRLT